MRILRAQRSGGCDPGSLEKECPRKPLCAARLLESALSPAIRLASATLIQRMPYRYNRVTTLHWTKVMSAIATKSFLRKIVEKLDRVWYVYHGFLPDFKRLDFVYGGRALFSTEGLIRTHLSIIPGVDNRLKRVVKELGGWDSVMNPNRELTSEAYQKLCEAGFTEEQLRSSREFLANPVEYMNGPRSSL